jgi:L-lysine exporter family protein LysE/ArgO
MFGAFIRGLAFGASLIIAIGAQNAFVIRQGLTKKHLFLTALLCSSIDAILICFGVFGFGAVVTKYPQWLVIAKYFAVIFLVAYGFFALHAAIKNIQQRPTNSKSATSVRVTILSILAFSLLNPHVYLDTVILMGSIAAQEASSMRWVFAVGAMSASFLWFFLICYSASFCAQWLIKPGLQRCIDGVIALTMWTIALRLIVN